MNLKANLLKKSQKLQISFTVVNIKHQTDAKKNGFHLLCSAVLCGKKPNKHGYLPPLTPSVQWGCKFVILL
jgi:hypothetical protein